jgi:hypothetical protein
LQRWICAESYADARSSRKGPGKDTDKEKSLNPSFLEAKARLF